MLRFSPLLLLLQAFCLYHAYKNKSDQKWYWLIIILPLIGCIIYLYHHFYSRRNIENLAEGMKTTFISNYKIEKLEQEVKVSDSMSNKIALANEHSALGNYARAIALYESCLEGIFKDDIELLLKLVKNNYLIKNYEATVQYGEQIREQKEFLNSEERLAYAWANYYLEKKEIAEQHFQDMDIRFSNYTHRLEYASFLNMEDRKEEAIEKLLEMLNEIKSMDSYERRSKKGIYKQIRNFYFQLKD